MLQGIPSAESIVQGRSLLKGFEESVDVVVVGSGAGGAVVAMHLAEAGRRVLLLEEGGYYKPEEYGAFRPSETMRKMWREGGLLTAFGLGSTPVISIAAGRCVGGSSVLTGGVCFRIPSEVHEHWVRDLGLEQLSEKAFEEAYQDVERRIHIDEVPVDMRSYATRRLVQGAESLGIAIRPTRRNTVGCQGNARCNHGCPAQAKQSVDIAYLPAAFAKGARLVSDALVHRVLIEGQRAVGVEGHLLDGAGKKAHRFRVNAETVVLACGTLHTPLVLMRSATHASAHLVGHGVTLHPAVRIAAQFDEPLDGFSGALQSIYSDHFAADGMTIVGVHAAPNVLAAGHPGFGPAHRERVRQMRGLAALGGMVHDQGGGQVRIGPSREPILWYRMAPQDLTRIRRLMTILGEIGFAAGAQQVYAPVFGTGALTSVEQLRALEHESIDPRRIECMAFHPLGSARMARDPRAGVVDPCGQSHEVSGLYVADGSVLPTSIGVNSQLPVMAMATKIAWSIRDQRSLSRPRPQRGMLRALRETIRWHPL